MRASRSQRASQYLDAHKSRENAFAASCCKRRASSNLFSTSACKHRAPRQAHGRCGARRAPSLRERGRLAACERPRGASRAGIASRTNLASSSHGCLSGWAHHAVFKVGGRPAQKWGGILLSARAAAHVRAPAAAPGTRTVSSLLLRAAAPAPLPPVAGRTKRQASAVGHAPPDSGPRVNDGCIHHVAGAAQAQRARRDGDARRGCRAEAGRAGRRCALHRACKPRDREQADQQQCPRPHRALLARHVSTPPPPDGRRAAAR